MPASHQLDCSISGALSMSDPQLCLLAVYPCRPAACRAPPTLLNAPSHLPATPACPPPAGNTDAARLAYAAGIKRCLDAVPLWVAAARLEEGAGNIAKARALLEQASAGWLFVAAGFSLRLALRCWRPWGVGCGGGHGWKLGAVAL